MGLVHPGEMGASIGAALKEQGADVVWVPAGRSDQTRARAEAAGLRAVATLDELANDSDIVLSICPPHAAIAQAKEVMACEPTGSYVDANAIAPATAHQLQTMVESAGATFVDADIIGGPARPGGHTRMYLSGREAPAIARLFVGSDRVETAVLGEETETASALKMCYAAWTKGTSALLIAIRAAAREMGVEEALLREWDRSQPGLAARSEAGALSSAPKAWRFVGEMTEIAKAFDDIGLPMDFALGAAEVYLRMSELKGESEPTLAEILRAVRDSLPPRR